MGNAKGAYPPREDRTVVEGAEIAPAPSAPAPKTLRRTDAHADPKVLVEVLEVFYVRSLTPKVPTRAVRAGRRSDWRCGANWRWRQLAPTGAAAPTAPKSDPLVVRHEISLHGRTISGGSGPRATAVRRLLVVVEELQLEEVIPVHVHTRPSPHVGVQRAVFPRAVFPRAVPAKPPAAVFPRFDQAARVRHRATTICPGR